MRILPAFLVVALAAASAGAQQIGQNKPADAPDNFTLSVKVQLVIEAVVVKDKEVSQSRAHAKDFTVTEDGVPQTVSICEHQNLAEEAKPLPASKSSDEDLKLYKQLTRSQLRRDNRNERYKNRRLLALYFDMSAMVRRSASALTQPNSLSARR